ncbi:hypothetical protein [Bianquea renquensis]|uniref:Uncharacterized protein n=1 Tax=Bianquea renquensis TaxID=2763661 RepID=A0A926DRF9_9FIRM|nr:hypothetical protein [Bianquea renquensis]MBC8541950.1 hypothetical protein [Bianquea renquensis]
MEGEKGKGYCVYLLLILAWLMLLVGVFWYIASREEERKLKSEIIQGSVDITQLQTELYTLNVSMQEIKKAESMTNAVIRDITKSSYALQTSVVYSILNDRDVSRSDAFFGMLAQTASHLEQQASGGALNGEMTVEALEQNLQIDMEELCAFLAGAYEKTVEFFAWQKETYGLKGLNQRTRQEKRSDLEIMKDLYNSILDMIPAAVEERS